MAKIWRVPSPRTVSMVTSSADSGLAAGVSRKRGGTPSSNISSCHPADAGLQVAGLIMVVPGIGVGVAWE